MFIVVCIVVIDVWIHSMNVGSIKEYFMEYLLVPQDIVMGLNNVMYQQWSRFHSLMKCTSRRSCYVSGHIS